MKVHVLKAGAKIAIAPVVPLAVLALAFTANAAVQLSYSVNGGAPTICTTGADSAGTTGVFCPSITAGAVTVTLFTGKTNWPGTATFANEFASTLQISNAGSTAATVVLWVSAQNFTAPTVPPGTITWFAQQSLDGTVGSATASSVNCVDQSNSLSPPGTP